MRRADFNNTSVYKNHGKRTLDNVHPPDVILFEHIATGDCSQVNDATKQYRQSHWASNPGTTQQAGPWIHFQP